MSRWISLTGAAIMAAANWWIYYKLAAALRSDQPEFIATILLVSILIHEIGHWIVMEYNGIKTYFVFLVIAGGVLPFKRYRERFKQLPWSNMAAVYMSGVIGNIIMVLGSVFLLRCGYLTGEEFLRILNLNGLLITYNLLPWWIFDGGHFSKLLFNSVSEDRDERYVRWMGIFVAAAFALMLMVKAQYFIKNIIDFILVFCLILWGLHFRATHDDPKGSRNNLAIKRSSQTAWAVCYVVCMIAGLIAFGFTPHWAMN